MSSHPDFAVGDRLVDLESNDVWHVKGYDAVRKMLVLIRGEAVMILPAKQNRFALLYAGNPEEGSESCQELLAAVENFACS